MIRSLYILILLCFTLNLQARAQCTPYSLVKNGMFHKPTVGNEKIQFNIPMAANQTFDKITLDLDVKHGAWNANGSNENHAIFWLNRGDKWAQNVYGYVNVFGPTSKKVKMANNVTQSPGVMIAKTKTFNPTQGKTYHYSYVYDAKGGTITLTVSESGNQIVTLTDVPAENFISSDPFGNNSASGFFVVFGHESGSAGPEVPTYGWEYSNLDLKFICPTSPCQITFKKAKLNATCNTCNDGSASAFAAGGTAPYLYQWSDAQQQRSRTVLDLLPGTYSVTVTDALGCSASTSVNIGVGVNSGNQLQPYAANPKYWQLDGKPVMLIGGNPYDNSWQVPDHRGYLDDLVQKGGNFVRCNMSHYQDTTWTTFTASRPFIKNANGKYDLTKYDTAHWNKFADYVNYAEQLGVVLHITLWDRFEYYKTEWSENPFNPANNITYTSAQSGLASTYSMSAPTTGNPFFETVPAMQNNNFLLNYQKDYVNKILSYLIGKKNIVINVANEHNVTQKDFIEYWANYVTTQTTSAGQPLLVTSLYDNVNWASVVAQPSLYGFVEGSKVASMWVSAGEPQYTEALKLVDDVQAAGIRPINAVKCRTQNIVNNAPERVWRPFFAGFAALSHHMAEPGGVDPQGYPIGGLGFTTAGKKNIRALRKFANGLPPWTAEPRNDLLSKRGVDEAYCMARPGEAYGIYFPIAGDVDLDLSADAGTTFDMQWIEIFTGSKYGSVTKVSGGSKVNIATPDTGSWAVYLVKSPPPTSIKEELLTEELHVYPIPSSSVINISWNANMPSTQVRISNLIGQMVKAVDLDDNTANSIRLDVRDLQPGTYLVSLLRAHGEAIHRRILVIR